jgi:predicted nucleic acid-binding protein
MYIDTSALVKLYVNEPDSESCEAIAVGKTLVSSRLLFCEFSSALLGKVSRGIISAEFRAEVWREFERDIASRKILLVTLDDPLVQDATDLLRELHPRVPLRTLDALHLATYLSIETGPLFTKDLRMRQAAEYMGLPLAC